MTSQFFHLKGLLRPFHPFYPGVLCPCHQCVGQVSLSFCSQYWGSVTCLGKWGTRNFNLGLLIPKSSPSQYHYCSLNKWLQHHFQSWYNKIELFLFRRAILNLILFDKSVSILQGKGVSWWRIFKDLKRWGGETCTDHWAEWLKETVPTRKTAEFLAFC